MTGDGVTTRDLNSRARAVRRARRHTLIVRVLRVAAPIAAIASLSLYVLSTSLTISTGSVSGKIAGMQLSREKLTMLNPELKGLTQEGGRYTVAADTASQYIATPDVVALEKVAARMDDDDQRTTMTADRGEFSNERQRLQLNDNIIVETDTGLRAELSEAVVDLKLQRVTSDQPVFVSTPDGWIRAPRMVIHNDKKLAVFSGRVRVMLNARRADKTAATQLTDPATSQN